MPVPRPRVVPHDDDRQPSPGPYDPAPPPQVTERDARKVAEAARETEWRKPSFGKQLFLGPAAAGPHRSVAAAQRRVGRERGGLPGGDRGVRSHQSGQRADRAGRPHPRRGDHRPGRARRVRHEDRQVVRRAGSVQSGLLSVADDDRLGQRVAVGAALGPPVDRRTAAAEALRHRRSRRRSSCPGWPPARSPRSCSPSRTRAPTRPGCRTAAVPTADGDYLLNGVKLWATNGTVASLLVVMARVPQVRRAPRRHHRVRGRGGQPGRHGRAAQRVPRPARPGEQRHPVPRRAGTEGERHRRRGSGPEDRAHHPEHRPAVAARELCRGGQVVPQRGPRVGQRDESNGDARSAGTRRSPRRSRSSRPPRTAWSPCWTCAACWPTTTATTSASRPRSSSCTRARWPGRSPTS